MGWSAYRKTGLTYHNPLKSYKGFTLVSPPGTHSAMLLNMDGQVVKRWQFDDFRPGFGKLLPNGNLMLTGSDPEFLKEARAADEEALHANLHLRLTKLGGGYTMLREYDFDGNLLWSYHNPAIHHDFHIKENGNILLPEWVLLPEELAKKVRGGKLGSRKEKGKKEYPMLGDDIIEVDRAGDIVNRIHTWQYLDPRRDPIQPFEGRGEWTHVNGLDLAEDGKIAISCRNVSRVAILDPATEKLVWKITDPDVGLQHHVTYVGKGNLQVFDNGMNRPFSRVIEIDPNKSEIVWEYKANPPQQFLSGHISSAQRLDMGNVFICEGTGGRLFEVTRNSEVVWEWITPFFSGSDNGEIGVSIYRAYRYGIDHPAFAGRDLNPDAYRQLNASVGLM